MSDNFEISFENAIVDDRKISEYLLNEDHPRGKSKAEVLVSRDFSKEGIDQLKRELIEHAKKNEIIFSEETPFGMLCVIEGKMNSPDRRGITIRSIWIIETNQNIPKFVTAYPI